MAYKFHLDELRRYEKYLTWEIKDQLIQEFKKQMLFIHQQSLLDRETGLRFLLNQERYDDLTLLY